MGSTQKNSDNIVSNSDTTQQLHTPISLDRLNDPTFLHGKDVYRFLSAFSPDNPEKTLELLYDIWSDGQFLHPRQLVPELIKRIADKHDIPEETCTTLNQAAAEILQAVYYPEPLTQTYESKDNAGLLIGLSHLYAQNYLHTPVSMLIIDVGNMGGTNKFFEALLETDDHTAAFPYTDAVVAKQLNLLLTTLDDRSKEEDEDKIKGGLLITFAKEQKNFRIIPIRTGGDEFALIAIGVTAYELEYIAQVKGSESYEGFATIYGVTDHPNPKDLENPYKNGITLGTAAFNLNDKEGSPASELMYQAEERITRHKEMQVALRNKHLPNDIQEEIGTRCNDNRSFEAYEEGIRHFLKMTKSPLEAVTELIRNRRGYARPTPLTKWEDISAPFSNPSEILASRLQHIPGHEEPSIRGIINGLVEIYTPRDPSTGVYTGRDLEAAIKITSKDANQHNYLPPQAIMLDFGNLGAFNDLLNHECGNKLLEKQADIIRETLSEYGIDNPDRLIHHMGGGKFIILIPPAQTINQQEMENIHIHIPAITKMVENKVKELEQNTLNNVFGDLMGEKQEAYGDKKIDDIQGVRHKEEHGIPLAASSCSLTSELSVSEHVQRLKFNTEKQVTIRRSPSKKEDQPAIAAPDSPNTLQKTLGAVTATLENLAGVSEKLKEQNMHYGFGV
jgi:diguanylate cyclase (GGDEF)-like protein